MKRRLGLDIGISSIGYSLIEYDDKNFEGKILDIGVRIFTAAENPKTGASLALPRREARLARRRLQRRSSRLYNIRKMLKNYDFISQAEIENLYIKKQKNEDVWTLRKEALNRILSNVELYRIMVHIAKRRGFKSIRKSEEAKNEGALLKAIKENKENLETAKFQTIGEMFATTFSNGEAKRNKHGNYKNSIPRELLEEEITIIFKKQRELGSIIAKEEIEKEFKKIAFYQKPLKSVEDMVGYCTFEKNEKRAPKCAYSSEIFTALNKLVNLSFIDETGNVSILSGDDIKQIINLAHKNAKVTYKQMKTDLDIDESIKIQGLNYQQKDKDGKLKNPEEATLIELKNYHAIRKAINSNTSLKEQNYFEKIKEDKDFFNNIALALTFEKSDEAITKQLEEHGIDNEAIKAVKDLSMNKTMHLSLKAIENIIPYMSAGYKYSVACEMAGYNHSVINSGKKKSFLLPVLSNSELTTNPVVNRAISQTRKVVNALIRKHGAIDNIIIETARDLSKSFSERKEIEKAQQEFQNQKEKAKQRCIKEGINPDYPKSNLLRFRLWEEQGGHCIYSGKYIDPKQLAEPNYTDIDHIIPYSRCFDDSLNNKVLCLTDENRNKGNKIPYEYIGEENWHKFVEQVKSMHLKSAKTNRLIRKTYSSDGFKSRNLNDTRYITKFIKDYIKENLDFYNNLKVETRSGSLTAFLRTQWGLVKNRDESDKHHALDATVLACSTQGMVQYLSTISAQRETYHYINGKKPKFKKPWETFNKDLEFALGKIFVSRAVRASVSSELHEATIRSAKHIDEGFTTLKTPLEKINLSTLEEMYDIERNKKVYNILKTRLLQFDNDPKKAFKEPVYMPVKNKKLEQGVKPHEIKTIKIKKNSVSGIKVHNGFAQNASMYRVDVFTKLNKKGKREYFLVPIYVADFGKDLPNKAISGCKDGWIEMDETYDFCFSLYPDTLISINQTGKFEDEIFGYYKGTDISTGTFTIESHDRSVQAKRPATKKAFSIKKYQVGVLGDYYEVKKEKRLGIKGSKN